MGAFQPEFNNFPNSIQKIIEKVVKISAPQSLILFGSRARQDHRENSDFDFAVRAKSCSEKAWNQLLVDLDDESLTLFKFDIVEFERVNKEYQANITREGVLIYG